MGKVAPKGSSGRFISIKQSKRLQNISSAQKKRWLGHHVAAEHNYSVESNGNGTGGRVVDDLCSEPGDVDDPQSELEDVPKLTREQNWREGRRVVDLGVLADALSSCQQCCQPLQLAHATNILTYGLSAILKVPCCNTNCRFINNIPTGKRHGRIWDANTKLSSAMIHTGIGGEQVNGLFAALNIPPVSKWLINARQQETGHALEEVAESSMNKCLQQELQSTEENGITVSVDAGWQKRGSGRAYDSLSGHCSMIGSQTGKILGYSVRSKTCRICERAERKQMPPRNHNCRRNWSGTAKAMEPDMVVEMVDTANKKGYTVETIIADDDATTISKLRKAGNPNMKKRSDWNHIKKNIASQLYSLQKNHKSLSTKVIKYIQKNLNYMLSKNQGDPDGICKGLEAVARHPFGDHSFCEKDWCTRIDQPEKKYSSLPYGKPLKDMSLKSSILQVLNSFKQHSVKLSSLGSTQANESFNHTISTKAPKSKFYSGSASLNYRKAAGVAQKNIGQQYLLKVHKKIGLSPGYYTKKLSSLKDLQFRKRKALVTTREAKRKRLELRLKRGQITATRQIREGVSYSPGIGLNLDPDIQHIPPPFLPPVSRRVILPVDHHLVFFDLEATGLGRTSHILQISALSDEKFFNQYVMPKIPITQSASDITGMVIANGRLLHNGTPVNTVSITSAVDSFLKFLENFNHKSVLVGHNIKSYDCPLLVNSLQACGRLSTFQNHVVGCIDTRLLFKITNPGQASYSQQNLVRNLLGCEYSAHDAFQDVVALKQLYDHVGISVHDQKYKNSIFSLQHSVESTEYSRKIRKNLPSLQDLVNQKVVSISMAKKIAGSDLNLKCLKLAFHRNSSGGISNIFKEPCGQHSVRVTKSTKIIDSVNNYLSKIVACDHES